MFDTSGIGRIAGGAALVDWVGGHQDADPVSLSTSQFDNWLSACKLNRVVTAAYGAFQDGFVLLEPSDADRLSHQVAQVLAAQLQIERALVEALDLLLEAGIETRVLKGVATAHLDYENPAHRQFGDGDFLVRPTDVEEAIRLLTGHGARARPVRGGNPLVQHGVAIGIGSVEVDLHHRLLPQGLGRRLKGEDLFADGQTVVVAGRTHRALPRHLRLLQATAQNVACSALSTKWSSDFDVLRMQASTAEALEVADRCGLGWVVRSGLRRAGVVAAEASSTAWQDRITEWTYNRLETSPRRGMVSEVILAPESLPVLVRSVVSPGSDYLSRRDRSSAGHLRRQFTRLVGRRR